VVDFDGCGDAVSPYWKLCDVAQVAGRGRQCQVASLWIGYVCALAEMQGVLVTYDVMFVGNVRVADSAVFPFEFAAHVSFYFSFFLSFGFIDRLTGYDQLASATYGVGELAAALLKTNSYDVLLNGAPSTLRFTTSSVLLALSTTAMVFIVQDLLLL